MCCSSSDDVPGAAVVAPLWSLLAGSILLVAKRIYLLLLVGKIRTVFSIDTMKLRLKNLNFSTRWYVLVGVTKRLDINFFKKYFKYENRMSQITHFFDEICVVLQIITRPLTLSVTSLPLELHIGSY